MSLPPSSSKPMRLVLSVGWTGGHVTPAIALADAYCERHPAAKVLIIGPRQGPMRHFAQRHGYRSEFVDAAPVLGVSFANALVGLGSTARGVLQARRLLQTFSAEMVLGFGSFGSVPAIIAARSLGLRTAIHEANAAGGLANRVLGRLVHDVYVGFDPDRGLEAGRKVTVTGTPVAADVVASYSERTLRQPGSRRRILVTAGTLGSPFLNRHVPVLLQHLEERGFTLEVLHQTGPQDEVSVAEDYRKLGLAARVVDRIDDMPEAYANSDFAIATAGAMTVLELAASGLPALLVPLGRATQDHQTPNAKALAKTGGSLWCNEEDWNAVALSEQIASLVASTSSLEQASKRLRASATPDAASRLVQAIDQSDKNLR